MKIVKTDIPGVCILEPAAYGDARGWFMEAWSARAMEEAGLFYAFVQDNHSYSAKKGTLRGIHAQKGEAVQTKLVRCTRGAVLDVAVDFRRGSPTYQKWVAVELTAANRRQLLIPRGFGHAFLTLTDDVEFLYKTDNCYVPEADRSIRWNDPALIIDWGTDRPLLSEKDNSAPYLHESDLDFVYEGCP